MILRSMANLLALPLLALPLFLVACETIRPCDSSQGVVFSDTQALEMIPFMKTGYERSLGGGRVRVEKSYWSASGFECKEVVLTSPEAVASKKLACFEGDEGRFVPSPFLLSPVAR